MKKVIFSLLIEIFKPRKPKIKTVHCIENTNIMNQEHTLGIRLSVLELLCVSEYRWPHIHTSHRHTYRYKRNHG